MEEIEFGAFAGMTKEKVRKFKKREKYDPASPRLPSSLPPTPRLRGGGKATTRQVAAAGITGILDA